MSSPGKTSSPTFRNVKYKHRQSPVELKEKMRKNYKDKINNCRNMLFNKFRGSVGEPDLRNTLTEIYKSMFISPNEHPFHEEEHEVLEEIRNELVQEELEWWLQEYEKSQMDNIDWSTLEQDNNVICPVCQKANFVLTNNSLSCTCCITTVHTTKLLPEIKQSIVNSVEKHNNSCNSNVQFTLAAENNNTRIYLVCETCWEMQCVV